VPTETAYWTSFRKHLVPRVYAWKINASYVKGIPDWWGSGVYQDLWVENKRIVGDKEPPAILDLTDTKKYLSDHQQLWLKQRYKEGRRVGVIVFSCKGHVYLPGLSWQKPISKLDFLSTAMPYKDLATKLINILGELPIEDQVG
jgi:hypothetical protein